MLDKKEKFLSATMAELGEYSEKKRSPKELGISSLDDVFRISNTGSNHRTN